MRDKSSMEDTFGSSGFSQTGGGERQLGLLTRQEIPLPLLSKYELVKNNVLKECLQKDINVRAAPSSS